MAVVESQVDVVVDDLTDVEFIATGGAGTVYRAVQVSLGRVVALKVLHAVDLRDVRIQREARVQALMSSHANVVTLFGMTTVNGTTPALIMEYVPGGSLQDRISRSGPLTVDEWMRVGAEVASAIAAAHDLGIVHRDVKPSNILFAADGSARLGDFGISGTGTRTIEQLEASVAFAAPEILEGDRPSPANDVFSLVLTILVAAVGRHPFGDGVAVAAMAARIQSEQIRFSDWVPDLPEHLGAALDRCLDLEPDERLTAAELVELLSERGEVRVRRTPRSSGATTLRRPHWVMVSVVFGILAALLIAVGWRSEHRAPVPDLCGALGRYDMERLALFNQVSSDIEQATSPVQVVDRLLVRHPAEWAAVAEPLLGAWAAGTGGTTPVSIQQLTDLAVVEALHALNGDKSELGSWLSSRASAAYPVSVRSAMQAVETAVEGASSRCGGVSPLIAPARARMYSSIRSGLADPAFMAGFFAEPASFTLMTPRLVELFLVSSRPFAEQLLVSQQQWCFELLSMSVETRDVVFATAPDLVLLMGESNLARFGKLLDDSAIDALRVGLTRIGPVGRDGLKKSAPRASELVELTAGEPVFGGVG